MNKNIEQIRGSSDGAGFLDGKISFRDTDGTKAAKWLREQGYVIAGTGSGDMYSYADTWCGVRLYSNGFVLTVDIKIAQEMTGADAEENKI